MKQIDAGVIVEKVAAACIRACTALPDDVLDALKHARDIEVSPCGIEVLDHLIENAQIARDEGMPICQDTGVTVVFVEVGQDAHIVGASLQDAINDGVRQGYEAGHLRKSIVRHPLDRANTGDNTPAVIHTHIVPGDRLRITVAPKGGGSENMGAVAVLRPSDGFEGVRRFVVDAVVKAGPNPCPPLIVAVGLGGTVEKAALLAKKAALRRVGQPSANPTDREIEEKLLQAVNNTGVGPAGLGGRITALAVHVESFPCHIGSLPVAVNLQCHAARHAEVEL